MTKLHYLACAILIFNFQFSFFNSVQAQQHRERWKASDYFPENHFIPPNASDYDDSTHYADLAGEVAHYMRLAGLQPWWPVSDEALTLIRISMLPRYTHPIFVEVIILDDDSSAEIVYNRGSAICGYVEHTTYLDTAWVDVTEQHDHGNLWVEGKLYDSEYKPEIWLSGEELDSLKRLLVETDTPPAMVDTSRSMSLNICTTRPITPSMTSATTSPSARWSTTSSPWSTPPGATCISIPLTSKMVSSLPSFPAATRLSALSSRPI